MKTFALAAFAALSLFATPALAQSTSVLAEVQQGGLLNDERNSTALNLRITTPLERLSGLTGATVFGEVEGRATVDGNGSDAVFGRTGVALVAGRLTLTPSVEVGYMDLDGFGARRLLGDNQFVTIGAGAGANFALTPRFALTGSVRYRTDTTDRRDFDQLEASAGGKFALNERTDLSLRYINRSGDGFRDSRDAVALGVGFKF